MGFISELLNNNHQKMYVFSIILHISVLNVQK